MPGLLSSSHNLLILAADGLNQIGRKSDVITGYVRSHWAEHCHVLVELGDPSRNMPPCAACHRPGSGGPIETPILAEQGQEYIVRQLKLYAAGERRNDVYGRMRTIAAKLTPGEIDGLATYYRAGFR